jgi:uncharacterized protein YndB with AHSA1/START domain
MENQPTIITVQNIVNATVEKVWLFWTLPEHITQWNNASGDWHTIRAENDVRVGGKFLSRMEAKDGSFGFDFSGVYNEVTINELIAYSMDDNRKAKTIFSATGSTTKIVTTFEAENENPVAMQQEGWQTILDNFKKYAEAN